MRLKLLIRHGFAAPPSLTREGFFVAVGVFFIFTLHNIETNPTKTGRGTSFVPLPSCFRCLPPSRRIFLKSVGHRVPRVKPLAPFGYFGEYQSNIPRHTNILSIVEFKPYKREEGGASPSPTTFIQSHSLVTQTFFYQISKN